MVFPWLSLFANREGQLVARAGGHSQVRGERRIRRERFVGTAKQAQYSDYAHVQLSKMRKGSNKSTIELQHDRALDVVLQGKLHLLQREGPLQQREEALD